MREWVSVMACSVALLSCAMAHAASVGGDGEIEPVTAPVMLDGEELFRVRGVTAYPAKERAARIAERIETVAADPAITTETVKVIEATDRSTIVAGDRPLVYVTDADAALERIDRLLLAEAMRTRIVQTILTYRYDRSPRVLLVNTAYAASATVVTLFLFWGIVRGFRRLGRWLETRIKSRIEGLEQQSRAIIQAKHLWTALSSLLTILKTGILLVIGLVYLNVVLGLYPWTRPTAKQVVNMMLDPLRVMGTGLLKTLPDLIFLAILAIVIHYVLKATRLFFAGIEQGTIAIANFDSAWAWPTYRIVRLLLIVFALVVAYPYIPGSGSEAFKGISIFLGVMVSLGSSSFIANLIAGYSLIYRRAFKVGDRVQINEFTGDVFDIRLQVTRLRTIKNEEIVVPNSLILNSHVTNYSTLARERGLILHTTVGIGYEVPWRQVEAMLLEAAGRTPGLLKEPAPFVLQKSLGDFAVSYEINVYCDNPQASLQLYTALHRNILDLFNEHGVQIMTPAYEGDPDQPKVVPKDKWFEPPATDRGQPQPN